MDDKFKHKLPGPPSAPTGLRILFSEPQPPIWHYTDFDAFESILGTGVLWASRLQFLNDEKEFSHCIEVIAAALGKRLGQEDLDSIQRFLRGATEIGKCVVCFSRAKDQLSQWRGYSRGLPVLSIGFDQSKLEEVASSQKHGWKLEQCIYEPDDKEAAVTSIVETIVKDLPAADVRGDARQTAIREVIFKVWDEFLHIAPRLKHIGFKEEEEVRLVSMPFPIDDTVDWHYRRSSTLVIPYVEFQIAASGGTLNDVIREIVIGPHVNSKSIAKAARELCIVRGIRKHVQISGIPYR